MDERDGESDVSIVPKKSANNVGRNNLTAEQMEGRDMPKGNESQQNTRQTQSWESVQIAMALIHKRAKEDKKVRFTALMHHISNPEMLRAAYFKLKENAAAGIDGQTWIGYGEELESKLKDLSERLKSGAYKAKAVRRVYIPKPDGRQRPLGVPALEDKIVQRATVEVLNAIYEADFVDFSFGFRPGRSQHQALDAVSVAITTGKVSWVLDADIRDFYGSISHEWMRRFIEHRIGDKRVVRLIQKWLSAGVLEEGIMSYSDTGTPQGGSASPLMSNVYLHYVYDLWVQQWHRRYARGEVSVTRFADDTIVGFQYKSDAEQFLRDLRERLQKFGLELHPDKTRLINFGRFAIEDRKQQGKGKPETFTFLGFTHMCWVMKDGWFTVRRQTMKTRLTSKVTEVTTKLTKRMHAPVSQVGLWLGKVLAGHYQYYGVPGNGPALDQFRYRVYTAWKWVLGRRSQKGYVTWERMARLIDQYLPRPKLYHPHPLYRQCPTQGGSRVR